MPTRRAILAAACAPLLNAAGGGWQSLFDGKTTNGWLEVTGLPFPDTWTVEDGCLKTRMHPDSFQDIRTVKTYRLFEFDFDWKMSPGGNSGVKYRLAKTDRWHSRTGEGFHARARGAEYQIADDESNPDVKGNPTKMTGALYDHQGPASKPAKPVGQWNQSRIVVEPHRVQHWLNGEKVVEYPVDTVIESPISLQHHDSVVWFRALRIREV